METQSIANQIASEMNDEINLTGKLMIIEKKLVAVSKEKEKNETDKEDASKDLWNKAEEFEKKARKIDAPFWEQGKNLKQKELDLEKSKREIELAIKLEQVKTHLKREGKHNVDTFKGLLEGLGFRLYSQDIIEKKPLENGVQIFRVFDESCYTSWFFFHKTELVGFSYRRAGEHRGDTTIPFSFLAPCNNTNKIVKIKKKDNWSAYEQSATFTEFCKVIGVKQVKNLKKIDASNPKVLDIIREHKGMNY